MVLLLFAHGLPYGSAKQGGALGNYLILLLIRNYWIATRGTTMGSSRWPKRENRGMAQQRTATELV
jgi:hypothetical protein